MGCTLQSMMHTDSTIYLQYVDHSTRYIRTFAIASLCPASTVADVAAVGVGTISESIGVVRVVHAEVRHGFTLVDV